MIPRSLMPLIPAPSRMYDTIIIGAGMSGLAAGIRLAHFGQRVCILERHSAIGGLNSFYRQRGRTYDVGLHAVTNYAPKGTQRGPLARLLRQLAPRLGRMGPGAAARLGDRFPGRDVAVLQQLRAVRIGSAPAVSPPDRQLSAAGGRAGRLRPVRPGRAADRSAREVVGSIIDDPLLVEMIFCPILFYGGAREHDIDFDQFSILFRAIFLEGLARPLAGIQLILKMLVRRFKELGGELRLRAAVENDRRQGRRGAESACWRTARRSKPAACSRRPAGRRRCGCATSGRPDDAPPPGRLSFVESISILDAQPRDARLRQDDRVLQRFGAVPLRKARRSGRPPQRRRSARRTILPTPSRSSEGVMRISALANYDRWAALDADAYRLAKLRWYDRMVAAAVRFVPDFRGSVIDTDMFTPLTIHRFTGHANGAVYGSAQKSRDGTTHLKNLYICGNDQGLVGIVGTIISGISIANRHLLK